MMYREGYVQLKSLKAFYRSWTAENPKGLVCGIHGFAEHSGRYLALGKSLSENGFSLYMYDLRGHGKTAFGTDEFGHVERFDLFLSDTREFLTFIREETGMDEIALLGHSMGGLIALHYAARIREGTSYLITSGAATQVSAGTFQRLVLSIMRAVNGRARVSLPINPDHLSHNPEINREYMSDPLVAKRPTVSLIYSLYNASREIWGLLQGIKLPVLMMHGGSDMIVPSEATRKAFELLGSSDKSIRIYPGMYHEILNEVNSQQVYEDILSWLSQRTDKR